MKVCQLILLILLSVTVLNSTANSDTLSKEQKKVLVAGLLEKGYKQDEIPGLIELAGLAGGPSISKEARDICLTILYPRKNTAHKQEDTIKDEVPLQQEQADERFSLSEKQRQQIFNALVEAQDRATVEAEKQFPSDSSLASLKLQGKKYQELTERYEADMRTRYGITKEVQFRISVEAAEKKWPLPRNKYIFRQQETYEQKKDAKNYEYTKVLTAVIAISDSKNIFVGASSEGVTDLETSVLVAPAWHYLPYEARLLAAEDVLEGWRSIRGTSHASVRFIDKNGKEVGGTTFWTGKAWVEK